MLKDVINKLLDLGFDKKDISNIYINDSNIKLILELLSSISSILHILISKGLTTEKEFNEIKEGYYKSSTEYIKSYIDKL